MPSARYALRKSKNQTKLTFRPISDPKTAESSLTKILSQYQLMRMITKHLSSADLVHLAATSKECQAYVMGSERIYEDIKSSAVCDGSGLKARATCFHHFKGDVVNATVECEGAIAIPCDRCQAHVCNSCRFHITYLDHMECCKEDSQHWEFHETEFGEMIEVIRRCHEGSCGECPAFHSGNFPIESIRAAHLCGLPRERRYCKECAPIALPKNKNKDPLFSVFAWLEMVEDEDDWCSCDIVSHFVDDSWLCIPCFFKEEAEAYSRRSKRDIYRWEYNKESETAGIFVGGLGERVRKLVKKEYICDCGEVADVPLFVECRWCNECIRTNDVDDFFNGMI